MVKIAETLNLGLDSFVFFDDDPREREMMRRILPQVTTVEIPEDPALYVATLSRSNYFEATQITSEDLNRTIDYRSNEARTQCEVQALSREDFLKSLEMRAVIAPFDDLDLSRITQLINKTNQFNVTTRRRSESDVKCLMNDSKVITRSVKLKDRFGDMGLICVLIADFKEKESMVSIDTWLMSCRVLKRGVENTLFEDLKAQACALGASRIEGIYIPTEKNKLVADLFSSLGFELCSPSPDQTQSQPQRWQYSLKENRERPPSFISVVPSTRY